MVRGERRALLMVIGVTAALFCLILIVVLLIPKGRPVAENRRVGRRVPSPILFLHGLGSGAETWKNARLTEFLQSKGLRFGGVVRLDGKGQAVIDGSPDEADFFLLAVSSSFQGLDRWTQDITKLVARVREATDAPRVVLVGHSAGGLAGRRYLVEHFHDHHVEKLVTIAAPHRGSELGLLSPLKKRLQASAARVTGWDSHPRPTTGSPLWSGPWESTRPLKD